MAQRSGGTIPAQTTVIDANQAIALLSTMHHWRCTKHNTDSAPPRYEIAITHAGCRVNASRRTFVTAANAALEKLRARDAEKNPTKMRIAK